MAKRGASVAKQMKTRMRRTMKMYLLIGLLMISINVESLENKLRNYKNCRSSQEV